jgi:hypothetical protein
MLQLKQLHAKIAPRNTMNLTEAKMHLCFYPFIPPTSIKLNNYN